MAKAMKLVLNGAAVVELLQSAAMQAELLERGGRIADAAGGEPDFEVRASRNRDRVVVFVTTATREAREAEAENRTLTSALDAGR